MIPKRVKEFINSLREDEISAEEKERLLSFLEKGFHYDGAFGIISVFLKVKKHKRDVEKFFQNLDKIFYLQWNRQAIHHRGDVYSELFGKLNIEIFNGLAEEMEIDHPF